MATDSANLSHYNCSEYLSSPWATTGLWHEDSQLWVLEALSGIEENAGVGFLQVGRPGVDGIGFGFRRGKEGLWAFYPSEDRFQLLATTLQAFINGWLSGSITV